MTKYGKKGDSRVERNSLRQFMKAAPGDRCFYDKCPRRRAQAEFILIGYPWHLACFRKAADPGIAYKHSYTGGRDE